MRVFRHHQRTLAHKLRIKAARPERGGDIRGAFGTIHPDHVTKTPRGRLLALLAIVGPGLIVMVGDNDAGGVSTYAQAGQNYGLSLLWILLLLIPVLLVNQEMVVRLGAVTGVGHARLIFKRFGKFWGMFSICDLFVLNFLTITTEFIGVTLALEYFGVSKYLIVPIAALGLIAITTSGHFKTWERTMLVCVGASFLLVPLVILAHPHAGSVAKHLFIPGIRGGINSTSMLLIIGIVGTTVAPWQLFFQQSNVIDKRITPPWINYERIDTTMGAIMVIAGALMIVITASIFTGTQYSGHFLNANATAHAIGLMINKTAGAFFAVVLLNASIIGASAVTLSTSYAFGDVFGVPCSLHLKFREAKVFYISFSITVLAAASIVLIPGAPLGVIILAVQALAGVLLPSASMFLLLLCNDKGVLGPWCNRAWLNVIASLIISTLVLLSLILTATVLFPSVDVTKLVIYGSIGLASGLLIVGAISLFGKREKSPRISHEDRAQWRMPPISELGPARWSFPKRAAMFTLSLYLVISVGLLIVKAIQLGGG